MANIKWDTQINLQQLMVAVISVVTTVILFGFSLKGQVDMSNLKYKNLEERQQTMDAKMDAILNKVIQIQLDLKDKADREDG